MLKLIGCNKITDASVKELGRCRMLKLIGCNKITDASIKELKKTGVNLYH
jgi:hypothetical protein